ncbi:hypothetical protein CHS0354_035438 [Potamilus streckersoni]|uniref:Uncharacterized protein n=1 Tax=Potamilus streckersoni TaxID=2493646 RepID=A0AAE0TEW2_9BIVA|nr:hypothetical protein CHS0354_035438 [Potamilus streckersoni]
MDEEEKQFQEKFIRLPSSFILEIEDLTKSKQIEINIKKLEHKCGADEFESNTETTRVYNLLCFLHWKADERDKAYEHSRKVLEMEKNNIVSLCNRVWMLRKDGQLTEANEYLTDVEILAESNKNLLLQGKAEIAYSYSVFGPGYFSQSVDLYNQLLSEAGETDIGAKEMQLWKLDLGIIYRKYCNPANMLPKQDWKERKIDQIVRKAASLFFDVASSNCPARWKGRCYASLAELSYSIYTGVTVTASQEELFPKEIADKNVEYFLDSALESFMDDSHVLKVCGKHFKYLQKLDKAEEVIRKSLSIRETSYGHHHLALVLKKRLKSKILKERRRCGEHKTEVSSSSNASVRNDTSGCNEQSQLGEKRQMSGLNDIENDNTYSNQSFRVSNEDGNCRKKSENNDVEKVALDILQNEHCKQQEPLSKDCYLRINTDKPQMPQGRYQSMKKAQAKGCSGLFSIPDCENEAVKEIIYHLDKAIEFGNEWASLDKGILLRQVNEPKRAFDMFRRTIDLKALSTTMITVSCYENMGACCRDRAKNEVDPKTKRALDSDAIKYFLKAIETLAYKASKQLDNLKDAWMAYPTLKDIFQPQERNIGKLRELVELSKMLKLYGETQDFIKQIKEMSEEQVKDPQIISGEIHILLAKRQFEEAAVLLDLQKCTNEKDKIDKELCKLVYLECALHLVNKKENAGQRFQQAFVVDLVDHQKEKSKWNLFLLYDEEAFASHNGNTGSAVLLAKKLEDFVSGFSDLRIACNSDKVKPGKWRNEKQTKQMKSSMHIILILDTNEKPIGDFEYFIKIAHEIYMQKTSKLSVIIIDNCDCPLEFTGFQKIYFKTEDLQKDDYFMRWAVLSVAIKDGKQCLHSLSFTTLSTTPGVAYLISHWTKAKTLDDFVHNNVIVR